MSFPEGLSCQIKNPVFVLLIPPLQLFVQGCSTEHPLKGIQTVAILFTYLLEFDHKTPLPKKPYTLIMGYGEIGTCQQASSILASFHGIRQLSCRLLGLGAHQQDNTAVNPMSYNQDGKTCPSVQ